MNREQYFRLVQELLEMTEPGNEEAVANAEMTLEYLAKCAAASGKAEPETLRMMRNGSNAFLYFHNRREDYVGRPGDEEDAARKRRKIGEVICPA